MKDLILWLIFAFAVVVTAVFTPKYLVAQKPGKSKTSLKYKMICSSMFVIAGLCAAAIARNTTRFALYMIIGLCLSWWGDFLLHVSNKRCFFVFGLFAFMSAHILYLTAYQNLARNNFGEDFLAPWQIILILAFLLLALLYCRLAGINIKNILLLPVSLYIPVLSAMLLKAISLSVSHLRTGAPLWQGAVLITGAICFFLSDATLGILLFNKKRKSFRLKCFNMITYFSGQLLLASTIFFLRTNAISC